MFAKFGLCNMQRMNDNKKNAEKSIKLFPVNGPNLYHYSDSQLHLCSFYVGTYFQQRKHTADRQIIQMNMH